MIKLIRNYFVITAKKINSIIFPTAFSDPHYIKRTLETGHISEAFLYLDENGFIQDQRQILIIYHILDISQTNISHIKTI